MTPQKHDLEDGRALWIREAGPEDAPAVLAYLEEISGQSDFLTFGPGELEITEPEEREFLHKCRVSANDLFILGLVDDAIVGTLSFSAGHRPRLRHRGEVGISVRKDLWGLGIGALMLDALVDWARGTQVVKKIDLRVRTDNRRAIRLFERTGFVREGTLRKEIFLNGEYFDHYWMGLEL